MLRRRFDTLSGSGLHGTWPARLSLAALAMTAPAAHNDAMRAFVCHSLSADRSGLVFEPEWPEPLPPAAGEVTVAISRASLNFPDLLMLSGGYQFRPELPFIPGTEACGTVIAAGAGAQGLLGTRVIVGARGGGFAERITLPASGVRPVPPGLNDAEAAAFTVGALTAWVGLMTRGRLRAGERVLVTGAGAAWGWRRWRWRRMKAPR